MKKIIGGIDSFDRIDRLENVVPSISAAHSSQLLAGTVERARKALDNTERQLSEIEQGVDTPFTKIAAGAALTPLLIYLLIAEDVGVSRWVNKIFGDK